MTASVDKRKEGIRARLTHGRETFLAAMATLDDEALGWRVWSEGGAWTARELIGHVAYAEAGMQPLITAALVGTPPESNPAFDIDRYNEGHLRHARQQTLAALLVRLDTSRRETLALLAPLDERALDRPAFHPVAGATTVEGIFRIIAYHERLHAKDLRAIHRGTQ